MEWSDKMMHKALYRRTKIEQHEPTNRRMKTPEG